MYPAINLYTFFLVFLKFLLILMLNKIVNSYIFPLCKTVMQIDFELKKVLLPPPLGNFADISYLEENFKPHL